MNITRDTNNRESIENLLDCPMKFNKYILSRKNNEIVIVILKKI